MPILDSLKPSTGPCTLTTALGDSRQRDGRSLPPHEWAAFDHPAQNLGALFMIGLAAVLSLCERAATDPGARSPHMIAERLRRIAGSGSERAHGFIKQLGARRLAGTEAERLFPMFPALCARAGLMPQPEIYLYKGSALNAFALGDSASSIILISEGLLARLDAKEMTAVLAHEIGHILNGDARVLALAAELNQMIITAVIA